MGCTDAGADLSAGPPSPRRGFTRLHSPTCWSARRAREAGKRSITDTHVHSPTLMDPRDRAQCCMRYTGKPCATPTPPELSSTGFPPLDGIVLYVNLDSLHGEQLDDKENSSTQ